MKCFKMHLWEHRPENRCRLIQGLLILLHVARLLQGYTKQQVMTTHHNWQLEMRLDDVRCRLPRSSFIRRALSHMSTAKILQDISCSSTGHSTQQRRLCLVQIAQTNNPATNLDLNKAIDSRYCIRLWLPKQHVNVHSHSRA